jgi:hypothetical protein
MMDTRDRNVLAVCLALLVFALLYALNPPGPRYYPLEGVWRWEQIPGMPSMAWYARVACASAGATAAYGLSRALPASARPIHRGWAAALAMFILFALLTATAYLALTEYRHWIVE